VNRTTSELSGAQLQANRFDIVSRLADDLAHEIKNPLNAIIINLEVLKMRISKGDVAGAADRTGVIEEEVRRLHHLIDRMLLLIRPERVEVANLPIDSALDEIVPLVDAQARLARNEFVTEGIAPVFVAVARDTFKFALLNLLMATHERLGEGGGRLLLQCATSEDGVTFVIEAAPLDGAELVEAGRPSMHSAARIAEALLLASGAAVRVDDSRITLVVPRSPST
jgi:signal transduction histidine kinase